MQSKIYALRDTKASFFHAPWIMQNDVLAKRQIAMAAQDIKSGLGFEPAAFDLFSLGDYDDLTGTITPFLPTLIINVKELISEKL